MIPMLPRYRASNVATKRQGWAYNGSKAFFWYMWYATKDMKWKNMALSKKAFFQLHPRPWMKIMFTNDADRAAIVNAVRNNVFQIVRNF